MLSGIMRGVLMGVSYTLTVVPAGWSWARGVARRMLPKPVIR